LGAEGDSLQIKVWCAAICFCIVNFLATGQAQAPPGGFDLRQEFALAGPHSSDVQYYRMESRMVSHGPDGTRANTDIYRLTLKCVPAASGTDGDRWTCLRFTIQLGDAPEVAIPSLSGWSYLYRHLPSGKDSSGQTLGIPHEPFANLKDDNGKAVPPANAYHVYNAFIDFHSFFIFTDRTATGQGIQDLTHIGQRIIHAAANSKASTNLGSTFAEGSFFQNGEVTLELKGVSLVDDKPCALIGYDSGESSFTMITRPAANMEVRTVGSSHYWGDIYKDMQTNWVRKATLTELVVSETTLPVEPKKIDAVIERSIWIQNIPEDRR
jgi:hypothetical protein